jgi:hypothetical protein
MNTIIHLLNPIQKPGSSFIEMKCGKQKHIRIDKINASENPDEVTCTKCLGFINNPARTLRKYGQVHLLRPLAFMLTPSWGYHFDIIAFTTDPAREKWMCMVKNGTEVTANEFNVTSFHESIEYIINLIENKFLKSAQS